MNRAVSPVLGVVLLAAVAVTLAAILGAATVSTAPPPEPTPPFTLTASVNATSGGITVAHHSPEPLNVTDVRLEIAVDGEPLPDQPPSRFLSAPGFGLAPSGPFNPSSDPRWEPGEPANLWMTGDNADRLHSGAAVRITIYREGLPVAATETRAD